MPPPPRNEYFPRAKSRSDQKTILTNRPLLTKRLFWNFGRKSGFYAQECFNNPNDEFWTKKRALCTRAF